MDDDLRFAKPPPSALGRCIFFAFVSPNWRFFFALSISLIRVSTYINYTIIFAGCQWNRRKSLYNMELARNSRPART